MRILALAIVMASIGPAAAQTYDPAYPVCLQVYGPATYYECRYTSLPHATRQQRAARHSASSIHISAARKGPAVISGIAGSTEAAASAAERLRPAGHGAWNQKGPHWRDPYRSNLLGMKGSPGKRQSTVFHRHEYPEEYGCKPMFRN